MRCHPGGSLENSARISNYYLDSSTEDLKYAYRDAFRCTIEDRKGVIKAEVRDDCGARRVWAAIHPPSYEPPAPSDEMPLDSLPTIVLQDQGGDWYGTTYIGFDETDTYRVVIHAEDDDGLKRGRWTLKCGPDDSSTYPLSSGGRRV